MRNFFRQPFLDVLACLERLIVPGQRRQPPTVLMIVVASLAVTWFIYVPIHELLHVGGCVWTGGEVTRLELSPRYGATILKNFFPFISSGSDYAGQLKGFDTHGSDWCYFITVFMPFALTVLIGVPLVKLAGRKRRPVLLGVSIVVGLAPFYNMPGDYYEMGSILTTRALTWIVGEEPAITEESSDAEPEVDGADENVASESTASVSADPQVDNERANEMQAAYAGVRSDDIYLLVGTIIDEPAKLGLTTPGRIAFGCLLVIISLCVDVLLAFATYYAGHLFAGLIIPRAGTRGAAAR